MGISKNPIRHELELFDRGIYLRVPHPDGLRPWVFRRSWGHRVRHVPTHALLAWNAFEEGWCICLTVCNKPADEIMRLTDTEYDNNEWMTKHKWVEIEQITAEQYAHAMLKGNIEPYWVFGKRKVHSGLP